MIMVLQQKTFSWTLLEWAFKVTEFILRWFIFCGTGLVGPFIPTTREQQTPWILLLRRAFLCPFYLVGTIALLSPAYTAFIFRYFIHLFRNPYHLSVSVERPWLLEQKRNLETDARTDMTQDSNENSCEVYSFSTMNLCLLPELGSKINNLDQTRHRARCVGERIIIDQFFYTNISEHRDHTKNGYVTQHPKKRLKNTPDTGENVGMNSHFSHLDFICCQEAFDRDCAKLLVHELHKVFPWVVYDVGICGIKANLCGLNSGLMVASRYPILDVNFKQFGSKTGLDHVCDKGLLMIKVGLDGSAKTQHDKVGYIFNTHLQAFPGDKPIVEKQLDSLLEWTDNFRQETLGQSERVVFDILCGDFNIDNLSPGEVHHGNHRLFTVYKDFGRVRSGKEKVWAVGTEIRISAVQDEAISTHAGLKKVLDDPYLRQQYLIDGDIETTTAAAIYESVPKMDKHGNIMLSPVGGRRRIDLILYRDDGNMEVTDYHFVARLASLTDHIPVEMKINCSHS